MKAEILCKNLKVIKKDVFLNEQVIRSTIFLCATGGKSDY